MTLPTVAQIPPHDPPRVAPQSALAAVTHPDPYPYYAELARRDGLWFDRGLGLHLATSPAAVSAVLAHQALRVRPPGEPVPRHLTGAAAELFGRLVRMNDGERHARVKQVLASALGATATRVKTPEADARTREVSDAAGRLAATYASELGLPAGDPRAIDAWVRYTPAAVMARLVGFAAGDAAAVARWVEAFVAGWSPGRTEADETRIYGAATAAGSLLDAAQRLAAAPPANSIAARAADAAAGRNGIDAADLAANLAGLVSQAFEATAGLLGNALVALARAVTADRSFADDLARDPQRLRRWLADVSRADPSVHNTRRFAATDCTVLGTPLSAGAAVLVVLAAANRGAAAAHELAAHEFGLARHACPGADAALGIVAGALQALLQSGFDVTALPRDVCYRPLPNARLPVFFAETSGSPR